MLTMSNANVTFSGQSVNENGDQMAIFSASWLEDFDTIYYSVSTQDNLKQSQNPIKTENKIEDDSEKVITEEETTTTTESEDALPPVESVPEMATLDMDVVDEDFRAFREKVTEFFNRMSKA